MKRVAQARGYGFRLRLNHNGLRNVLPFPSARPAHRLVINEPSHRDDFLGNSGISEGYDRPPWQSGSPHQDTTGGIETRAMPRS
jgi:hypothetical protein